GTGVIPFSTDSGINRYIRLAPVLRSMARRGQWRGHFHAVIKYLLDPARDENKDDASGGPSWREYSTPYRPKMSESGCILNINRYQVKIDVLFGDGHRPYL